MLIRLHNMIVDREIGLAVEQPRAAADDLLETPDHRASGAISTMLRTFARIPPVESSAKWSGSWDGFSFVLERQQPIARRARVIRRHPHA